MYALFLETKAAKQCAVYAERNEIDVNQFQLDAYVNSAIGTYGGNQNDDWWVRKCLNNDSHRTIPLNALFLWRRTPQGEDFWRKVYREGR